ncbi:ACP phosphodiesterase [Orbus sturtevantii]|uniref:acyl carrier protein phosphodiesterase n=1 Tax=Orbus sturtevantii TaxID=3074109 RepID=UPI00370D5EBE
MNILAHLHLASLAGSSIIGNAAADFVKGDPYRQYSTLIADGIMMHRRLDKLIDQLPTVKQAKSLFCSKTQRVAPITLDIVWDHFLAKHWTRYVKSRSLADFNLQMRSIIEQDIANFPSQFCHFMTHLWQGEWLVNYANIDFIGGVLNGMANQRPKLVTLRESFLDFTNNYQQLEQIFFNFYPQLITLATNRQL